MSTQAIHFLKITGKLAAQFESACEAVLKRKPPADPGSRGGSDWQGRDCQRIDHLGLALLSAADALPVVWHSQYIDGYSWGWAAEPHLGWPDGVSRSIYSLNTNIAYFPAALLPEMLVRLKRTRRLSVYNEHLRMAIETMPWAEGQPLVVVISRCLGGSWEDTEVHAARHASLKPLLTATRDQIRPQIDGRSVAGLKRRLHALAKRVAKG